MVIEKLLNYFKDSKVFITGHTGFKGSWLSYILDSSGAKVKGFSLMPSSKPSLYNNIKLSDNFQSFYSDIRNYEILKREITSFKPDFIFHMAAQPLVLESYSRPKYTNEVNFNGTLNLLEILRTKLSNSISLFITTDKIYKNIDKKVSFKESDKLGGFDPYSASKAASEIMIDSYHNSFMFSSSNKIASVRAGNVIGGGDWSENRLLPDIIRSAFDHKKLKIRNIEAVRPWQHVLDPLIGYLTLAKKMTKSSFDHSGGWNFGPKDNNILSVRDILEIIKSNGINPKIEYTKIKQKESGYLMLDVSKSKKKINWEPVWDTSKSVEISIEWYKKFYNGISANQLIEENLNKYKNEANILR